MNGHILFTPLETAKNLPFSLIICKIPLQIIYWIFPFQPNMNYSFHFRSLLWLLTLKIHYDTRQFLKNTLPVTLTAKYSRTHSIYEKTSFYKNVKIMIYNAGLQHHRLILHYIYYIYLDNTVFWLPPMPISYSYFTSKSSRTEIFLLKINRWQHGDTFNTYQTQ